MLIRSAQSDTATCPTPEGTTSSSLLIGFGISDGATDALAGPNGWTPLHINTSGDDFRYACWYLQLSGSPEASYTITGGVPGFRIVAIVPESGETIDGITSAMRDNDASR